MSVSERLGLGVGVLEAYVQGRIPRGGHRLTGHAWLGVPVLSTGFLLILWSARSPLVVLAKVLALDVKVVGERGQARVEVSGEELQVSRRLI